MLSSFLLCPWQKKQKYCLSGVAQKVMHVRRVRGFYRDDNLKLMYGDVLRFRHATVIIDGLKRQLICGRGR